jgi:hypothetical protein
MSLLNDLFVDSMVIGSYSRLGELEAESAYQSRRMAAMAEDQAVMRAIAVRRDQEDRAYKAFREATQNATAALVRWYRQVQGLRSQCAQSGPTLQEAAALKVAALAFWRIQWRAGTETQHMGSIRDMNDFEVMQADIKWIDAEASRILDAQLGVGAANALARYYVIRISQSTLAKANDLTALSHLVHRLHDDVGALHTLQSPENTDTDDVRRSAWTGRGFTAATVAFLIGWAITSPGAGVGAAVAAAATTVALYHARSAWHRRHKARRAELNAIYSQHGSLRSLGPQTNPRGLEDSLRDHAAEFEELLGKDYDPADPTAVAHKFDALRSEIAALEDWLDPVLAVFGTDTRRLTA